MGIFGRMKTLLKANVNDLASKAEDPEKILNQVISDMEDQLRQAKLEVRDTIADRKRLEKQRDEALAKAKDWEQKAMKAVKADRDELAREALGRKQEQDELAAQYQASYEQQAEMSDKLRVALRQLSDKIDEARRKKNVLIAKQKRVEAQTTTATAAGAVNSTSAFDTFEAHASKIEDFEANVEAHAEIDSTIKDQELETKFSNLEATAGGDDALEALKRKMGHGE